MKALRRISLAILLVVTSGAAQRRSDAPYWKARDAAANKDQETAAGYANVGFSPEIMAVRHKPFEATRTWTLEETQKPPNNGQSPAKSTLTAGLTIARDSRGRIHYESATPSARGVQITVMIYDPVAHTLARYATTADHTLPAKPIAHLRHLQRMSEISHSSVPAQKPERGDPPPDEAGPPTPARPANKVPPTQEVPIPGDLGHETINGLSALGWRDVFAYGNDPQDFMIQDSWFAPQYALNVRQVILRSCPDLKTTIEVQDFIAGEPPTSLFQVPPGYEIVDDSTAKPR